LVLRGPAGCGKTTTISLLSEALGYDIIEWRNPPVPEHTSRDYVSSSAQFEEFLGRGDRFGGLDLQDSASTSAETKTNSATTTPSRNRRVLLVEEFPTVLHRNSSSLAAFRNSIQRYLAASASDQSFWSGRMHPPIVMVVSETMLTSASSISDNLTVHRLLGPTLYNHPNTTIIDFNSIAATFMQKALRTVLEKEASFSKRSRIPGPAALTRIAEIGDIRSAISSLEFLCLKGDKAGSDSSDAWGGSLTKKKSRADADKPLTAMEQESLELISQREASLGMFHAVGKIVYNKRLDASLVPSDSIILPQPPEHLAQHRRPKVSQVAVDELVDETGTDISTFISALHENYPPSCDGYDFVDSLNACIEALSDSDILGADRRSTFRTRGGIGANLNAGGVDMLRQDEISFQVASRGLLFALPYPVKRKLAPVSGQGRPGDAYKMLYPSSLRLWRKTEEIDGLVDAWMKHLLDPSSNGNPQFQYQRDAGGSSGEMSGVSAWRNRRLGDPDDHKRTTVATMMRRHDVLLDQLPYMAIIKREDPDAGQLRQITNIRGSHLDGVEGEDEEDDLVPIPKGNSDNAGPGPPLQQEEEKLILSDDDIED
jgi:cell cycle checkpoint protein